jgi:acyl-CoA hydrolase
VTRPPLPAPTSADAVLDHIGPGTALIVPLANGEPRTLLDAVEAGADRLDGVTVHQMHALYDRPYLSGVHKGRLDHVSYFLSPITRPHFAAETVDLVPANFSEVPVLLRQLERPTLVLAAASPPDRHGYLSLGTNSDYVAAFLGRAPWFVEVNPNMPRTFGRNQIHLSQLAGWCEADYPLLEAVPKAPTELERRIGAFVAERIPNRACIQAGIGGIPNAVLELLADHHDLGVHTELLADGIVDLIEAGAVTGIYKRHRRGKVVTTFALGTRRVYDFLHENPIVELLPVDLVNDPRFIGDHDDFVSINATTEVDLFGQCASETIGGKPWSGSGGQADFARGAMYSSGGQGFIVLPSTANANGETVSRIVCRLTAGSVVTTSKNTVDHVVTEYGVAKLRGRSLRERTRALIGIAHPDFRDELTREADTLGFI